MAQLKYFGRRKRYFCSEADDYIYAAGLTSDSNLNVEGLYTAEQARYAVDDLIKGLKNIGAFDAFDVLYVATGGTYETTTINVKDPTVNQLLPINSANVQYTKYGFKATNGSFGFDTQFKYEIPNINFGVNIFIYDEPINLGTLIWQNTPGIEEGIGFGDTTINTFNRSQGASAGNIGKFWISKSSVIEKRGYYSMSRTNMILRRTINDQLLHIGSASKNTSAIPNTNLYLFGIPNQQNQTSALTNVNIQIAGSRQTALTAIQDQQVKQLFNNYNTMLNRNPFRI